MPKFPNKTSRRRRRTLFNTQNLLICFMLSILLLYVQVAKMLLMKPGLDDKKAPAPSRNLEKITKKTAKQTSKLPRYSDWRKFAVDLAGMLPVDVLRILREEDPFEVRTFEKMLLETESKNQRFLELEELRELFPCPTNRISLPDQRNTDKARAFRNGTEPFFLFFQHLRKAGGTNFCSLAEHNLEKKNLPSYYCSMYSRVLFYSLFIV